MEQSVKAVEEVETNLEKSEDCFCPCGELELKSFKLDDPDTNSFVSDWRLEELSFGLSFKDVDVYNFPTRDYYSLYGPKDGDGTVYNEGEVIDVKGTEEKKIDKKNLLYIANDVGLNGETLVLKKEQYKTGDGTFGIPIDFLDKIKARVEDYDRVGDNDVFTGNLGATAIMEKFNTLRNKCSGDEIDSGGKFPLTIPLTDPSGSTGEFTVLVKLRKLSECAYLGSTEQWCSTQTPNCPDDTSGSTSLKRYCYFDVYFGKNKCKAYILEDEPCDIYSDTCLSPNECFEGTCQELPATPCQNNFDCDSVTYCDNDDGGGSCMPKIDISEACTDIGQCSDSYCDGINNVCTAFGERGAFCDDDQPCNTDRGSTCVDDKCKDRFEEDCFVDGDCGSSPLLYCADGTCRDRQPNVGSCTRGSECETFYCDPDEFVCADRPAAESFLLV